MKLLDLVHDLRSKTRNLANVIFHPFQVTSQALQMAARNRLEAIDLPFSNKTSPDRPSASPVAPSDRPPTRQPTGSTGSTGSTGTAVTTVRTPSLVKQTLQGRRSRYQVAEPIPNTEQPYLYEGSRSINNAPVLIKAYDLSDFNTHEIQTAQRKLERLDSLSFHSGGVQDFRLVVPADTWIDPSQKQGYVITAYTADRFSLRDYLLQKRQRGQAGLPPEEVRQILTQVLQTLWFMHNHPVRFLDGTVQRGIAHGNLSLDSLLYVPAQSSNGNHHTQFYIYVNDLGIWKEPFQRSIQAAPVSIDPHPQIKRDLISLGIVGFYLLVGEIDGYPDPFVDPQLHPRWSSIPDEPLKTVIRQLLGIDRRISFSNADEVRQALEAKVSPTPPAPNSPPSPPLEETNRRGWIYLTALLLLLFAAGMGVLAWRWLTQTALNPLEQIIPGASPSQFAQVEVPAGNFQYSIFDRWRDALGRGRVAADRTLTETLTQRDVRFSRYQLDNQVPHQDFNLLNKLRTGQLAFILGTWDASVHNDLQHEVIAYDGVVVFVAFSDPERPFNIAQTLQGKLSFRQLQQLYTSESDWPLPYTLTRQDIEQYAPKDDVAIALFEQQVLQKQSLIDRFRDGLGTQIVQQDFNPMVANILQDFENRQQFSIGFARLSKVLGQCSVYPLAIGPGGQEVQPITVDGRALTPDFDLCNRKGSYMPDARLFQEERYPLIYPLSVIYTAQGQSAAQAFINALKTDAGQCLLSEAGLVPIRSIRPGDCSDVQ